MSPLLTVSPKAKFDDGELHIMVAFGIKVTMPKKSDTEWKLADSS